MKLLLLVLKKKKMAMITTNQIILLKQEAMNMLGKQTLLNRFQNQNNLSLWKKFRQVQQIIILHQNQKLPLSQVLNINKIPWNKPRKPHQQKHLLVQVAQKAKKVVVVVELLQEFFVQQLLLVVLYLWLIRKKKILKNEDK